MSEWRDALAMLEQQFDHENAIPLYELIEKKMTEFERDSNILQCLNEAGIDNVEAYSIGMQLYYERHDPDGDWA